MQLHPQRRRRNASCFRYSRVLAGKAIALTAPINVLATVHIIKTVGPLVASDGDAVVERVLDDVQFLQRA